MQANVIRNERIKKHNVEPYHFKVLGSSTSVSPDTDMQEALEEFEDAPPPPRKKIKDVSNDMEQEESIQEEPQMPPAPKGEDGFVEKLLKKTDELSSNIIKLQMQIENQESEFEKRLADEIERTKELAQKEGYEAAKKESEEEIKVMQVQYGRSVNLLEQECVKLQEFIQNTETELTNAAIDVAKEVIQKELEKDSTKVASSLAKALMEELEDVKDIQIKVNPKDYEALKEEFEANENVKVSVDEAIAKGGVIVLSGGGNLDGTIATRLEKIIQMMEN